MEIGNGRYRLVRRLGEGGTGVVYQAADLVLGRTVAVKILHPRFTPDMLHREGQSLACLNHRNVVAVHDVVESDGCACLVMEFVDGCTLEQWLQDRGRLPLEGALHVFRQVTRAIRAAHARNLLHCDLKPANVLVSVAGEIKLTDFTLARQRVGGAYAGLAGGSARYAAPEQLNGAVVTQRTDVYGLGALLQRLLDPATLDTPEGKQVRGAIEQALAPDPDDRFASVDAFVEALPSSPDEVTQIVSSSRSMDLTRVAPVTPGVAADRQGRRWPLAALAAALALLAAVLWVRPAVMASPTGVTVPDLVATQRPSAELVIRSLALHPRVTLAYSATVPSGVVMAQHPSPASRAALRSVVRLVVSEGPKPVAVPDLHDLTQVAASAQLRRLGLRIDVQTQETVTGDTGKIADQSPAPGVSRLPGATVTILVTHRPWWWPF